MSGEATFSFPYPPEIVPANLPPGLPHVLFCYSAHVVRVEVDSDLGTIDVKEIVAIHDVGRAINPVGVEGQIEGGVAMGVGYALQEEVVLKADGAWTDSLTEYLLPTTLDTPRITPIILEYPEPSGPYGAKGVGEAVVGPVAPAIANAVADATGVRVTSLPIRPEALVGD
jgi:CO/xanthine dehydrogenase Mo-binding subunit